MNANTVFLSLSQQVAKPSGSGDPSFFDEERFPPVGGTAEVYSASLSRGYDVMKSNRVVIAGLVRDSADILPSTTARIERLGSYFQDYRVVVYENDSSDKTRELLHAWGDGNSRVTAICEQRDDPVNQATRCLARASRMAYYRTQCHQVVTREYARFDHVILVDLDIHGGWSYDGVAHTFGQSGWDFVGANGIIYRRRKLKPNAILHYDAWAYRLDRDFTPLTTEHVNRMLFYRGQPMQRVASCFGGLGIYRMPAYLSGQYDGADIEHVSFHREMHRHGFTNTFLNPSLITVYGRRHRSWDRVTSKVIRAMDVLKFKKRTTWQHAVAQKEAAQKWARTLFQVEG